jgi:hypothetical protein
MQGLVPQSAAGSPLQALVPKLLHHVFEHLHVADVKAARVTCSALASVGLDYLGRKVTLVYHRDIFAKLEEIAQHPIL